MVYFGKIEDDVYGFALEKDRFDSCVEVDDKTHMELIESGKRIIADENGNPMLTEWPQPTAEELAQMEISKLNAYLTETDWYAVRFAETGKEIPADILEARETARARLSELKG